jgi:hypothetical protein
MSDEKTLKSSYELAMERLRQKDQAAGIDTRPLTDAQKAAIAEVRSFYEAKIAQAEVLFQSSARVTYNPEERDLLAQQFRREREQFESEREAKIEKIRAQER